MRRGRIRMRITPIPQAAAAGTFALPRHIASRSHAVPLLQLFALTVMVIPSDTVIQAIGAGGYPAGLVGLFAFAAFRRRDPPRLPQTRCDIDIRFEA